MNSITPFCLASTAALLFCSTLPSIGVAQWKMHVIDQSSKGADGVRLADFDGDGRLDVVTGWEEGGEIRVYQNPGPKQVTRKWPAVTVGKVKSPEDAVFVDLDGNGILDVVSSCEGKTRAVYVHWAPDKKNSYLDSSQWTTEDFPAVRGHSAWMFATPFQIDGKNGVDLFVGSKGKNACVGWLESPAKPRELTQWKFHPIVQAGWIMSLQLLEVQDSRRLLVSDRKGPLRGVYLLEPLKIETNQWKRIDLSDIQMEYMFLDQVNRTDGFDVAVATRNGKIRLFQSNRDSSKVEHLSISNPDGIGNGKAVALGDIDLDGTVDLVHSANTRGYTKKGQPVAGVHWVKLGKGHSTVTKVASAKGTKFDRLELIDLDEDGDLDVLTCEEATNLGVVWFENPKL